MKYKIIIFLIIFSSLISGIILYPKINDNFASHWDSKGEVDGYMSKNWGILLLPVIMIILYFLLIIIPKIDPLKKNIYSFKEDFDSFILVIILFFAYIHILTIVYNTGIYFNLSKWILPALGILIYKTGIMITRSKRNWFIGIRTPWTLSSDYVWDRTHEVSGNLFKISGIIIILSIFIFKYSFIIMLASILFSAMFSVVYSYYIFKKKKL